jgi:hypothetical protein
MLVTAPKKSATSKKTVVLDCFYTLQKAKKGFFEFLIITLLKSGFYSVLKIHFFIAGTDSA